VFDRIFRVRPRIKPLIYFWRGACEIKVYVSKKEKTAAKYKGLPTYDGGLNNTACKL